jgi:hypothetical protein
LKVAFVIDEMEKEAIMKNIVLLIVFFIVTLSGCTTVGMHDNDAYRSIDFGSKEDLRICVYRDVKVSDEQVDRIVAAIRYELGKYRLDVGIPWIRSAVRPAFSGDAIIRHLAALPLEEPCDRLFFLVGRDLKDLLWGTFLPEKLGAVETVTMTKGFVAAQYGSLNQLLSLKSPVKAAIHEIYHMLGCEHDTTMSACYDQIDYMKKAAKRNRLRGNDFFPGISSEGYLYRTRASADKDLQRALQIDMCKDSEQTTENSAC